MPIFGLLEYLVHYYMEDNNKPYEAPTIKVIYVKSEGIICASGDVPGMPGYPGGGDPFNP